MGITSRWKSWLRYFNERRRSKRMRIPLMAIYPNGGKPGGHEVKNAGLDGAWIATAERWYPGTIVSMVLRYDPHYLEVAQIAGRPDGAMTLRARVLRLDAEGVGVEFVFLKPEERRRFARFLDGAQVKGQK